MIFERYMTLILISDNRERCHHGPFKLPFNFVVFNWILCMVAYINDR